MSYLFLLLVLISIIALIVGLIQPKVFSKLFKARANRKIIGLVFGSAIVLFFILAVVTAPATTETTKSSTTKTTPIPTPTATSAPAPTSPSTPVPTPSSTPKNYEEMNNVDLILNCNGGDTVTLWDTPRGIDEGARPKAKVPCGTFGFAYAKFSKEGHITLYGVNTYDKTVKNAYGWVGEGLITWR